MEDRGSWESFLPLSISHSKRKPYFAPFQIYCGQKLLVLSDLSETWAQSQEVIHMALNFSLSNIHQSIAVVIKLTVSYWSLNMKLNILNPLLVLTSALANLILSGAFPSPNFLRHSLKWRCGQPTQQRGNPSWQVSLPGQWPHCLPSYRPTNLQGFSNVRILHHHWVCVAQAAAPLVLQKLTTWVVVSS